MIKNKFYSCLLFLLSLLISFLGVELVLMYFKFVPGKIIYPKNFHETSVLLDLAWNNSDKYGIVRHDLKVSASINRSIKYNQYPKKPDLNAPGHNKIIRDFLDIKNHKFVNEFSRKYIELSAKSYLTDYEKMFLKYVNEPLNKDGFRSIPFDNYKTKNKKILLLGDSFTWGHTTENITNSFADILLARGYYIYNSGIDGTDPLQYLNVAKKYIPLIRPDIVIVNFYVGNDLGALRRPQLKDGEFFSFTTNAGFLFSLSLDTQFYYPTAEATYKNILKTLYIPTEESCKLNQLFAKTRITTQLWKISKQNQFLPSFCTQESVVVKNEIEQPNPNLQYLHDIKRLSQNNNAQLIVVLILDRNQKKPKLYEFESLRSIGFEVAPIPPSGYQDGDDHYNDVGHLLHANFLQQLIASTHQPALLKKTKIKN